MTPVYTLPAASCPAIQDPGAAILISAGGAAAITTAAESIIAGDTGLTGTPKLNRNAGRLDNLGRYGGGHAGAIWWGLELDAGSGLTLEISAGQAGIDSGAEVPDDTTLALADNTLSRVWLSRAGVLSAVTSGSGTPLGPPDLLTVWTFLGAVTTAAGVITSIDYSGRLTVYRGGQLWRRTYDAGAPTDTPPASVRFWTRTPGGSYFWDGTGYLPLGAGPVRDLIPAGTTVFVPSGYQQYVFHRLIIEGRLIVEGRLRVES